MSTQPEFELEPKITRHWQKQWDAIISFINSLMHGAPGDKFTAVCKDGFRFSVVFSKEAERSRQEIDSFGVIVKDREAARKLRELWPETKNPALGRFFSVPAADVIELAWKHRGIDMAKSREATQKGSG